MKDSQAPSRVFTDAPRRRLVERGLNWFGRCVALFAALSVPWSQSAWAANTLATVTNGQSSLSAAASFSSNPTEPAVGYDVEFTTATYSPAAFTLGAAETFGSLDDLSATALTIADSSGGSAETLTLGGSGDNGNGVSGNSADLLYVASGASLTFTGGSGTTALNLALGQSGNFDIVGTANIGSVISGGFGLTLTGGGTLTLSGANTYTGTTTLDAGTLTLSGALSYTSLALGGGTLDYTASGSSTQSFTNTILVSGISTITTVANDTVNLGTITRDAGSLLNISSAATGTTTTSNTGDGTGILGTWATSGSGTALRYAAGGGGAAITAYSNTINPLSLSGENSATTNYTLAVAAPSTLTGSVTGHTLQLTGATSGATLANGGFNIALDGLLSSAGTAQTISGTGNIVIGAGSGTELDIENGGLSLTISSNIVDNAAGASSLVYAGSAALILSGVNTYSGGTYLDGGTVTVNSGSSLGTGTIYLAGVAINESAASTFTNNLVAEAGTNNTMTPSGASQSLTFSGALTGSGNLTLVSGNSATGNTAMVLSGDMSQYTGILTANTVAQGNIVIGGATAADNNLGQAVLQVTGIATTHRLATAGGITQVGALESAPGAGTLNGGMGGVSGNYWVGALNTNTSFGSVGTGGSTQIITKVGTGTLTLNTSNAVAGNGTGTTSTWNFNVNNGTLVIDESNLATPTDIYNGPTAGTTGALSVGGGTLTLLEKAGTATSQGFTSTTINAGNSAITASQNGGSAGVLLQLGGITHNHGGAVNFVNPGGTLGSTNGITTTTANGTGGILGGYATVGGVAFAVSGGGATSPISALSTYAQTWSTGNVIDTTVTDNDVETGSVSLNAATTINSLTINDTSSSGDSLNMGNHGLTVSDASAGGLLYAGNGSGAGSYTINGTADLGAGSGHEFIVNVNTGATLTINTPLIGTNTGYLTTAGGGTLVLTAASTFTSSDYLNAGTVTISADNDLGTNSGAAAVTMNGGTLELASNYGSTLFSNNRGITLGNDGGTINTNSNNVSYGGVITGGTVNTTSANTAGGFSFTKAGGGTLTLTGANTYGGATIVTGGTLSVNSLNVTEGASGGTASSIGEAPNTEPYLVLNGGNLQYTGGTATTDRQFTLGVNGGGIDNSGSGALNWAGNTGSAGTAVNAVAVSGVGTRTFTLTGSYTSSANTFGMILGDSAAGATSVAKTGAGEWNLTAANTYSGSTTVSAGTLEAGVANALGGTTSVAVNSTGTLLLGASSAINSSATMTLAGGTFNAGGHSQGTAAHGASADSAGLGALTLSANSTLDFGSGSTTSVIAFASAGTFSSNVKLTIDDWNGTYGSADGTSNAGVSEDALYFGTTASLTVAQLADIQFYNGSHDYAAAQASNGEVYASTTVVPEPSTVFAALALFGFVGYRERRRVLLLMHALTKSA